MKLYEILKNKIEIIIDDKFYMKNSQMAIMKSKVT